MATEMMDRPAEMTGLTSAEVRERVSKGAVNVRPQGPNRTTAEIVRANVVTRFNILLGVLLIVILVAVRAPRDALFGIVLVANAAIGIVQELRAKVTLDRLSVLTSPRIEVIREGERREIAVEQVVRDDLVALGPGDQLPVDGTVLESHGLEIDESLLTGESDPIVKEVGDAALSGSFVVAGRGIYRADRVGPHAYAVALANEAKRFALVRSELRAGIDWILAGIGWAVGPVIALLLFSQSRAGFGVLESLRSAVAGAVGMVPQGLVLLTSIAFAVGVIRLGRRNVLVQELPAIEGLARVDIVCFDKTGTLTEGALAVSGVERLSNHTDPAAALGALGSVEPNPNATLQAIVAVFPEPEGWRAGRSVPFSSARKWSGTTFGDRGTWILGAPDIVTPDHDSVSERAALHAGEGRRVVALAHTRQALDGERLPEGLVPVALVVLGDRIRADAADTLRFFAEQGVQAKVISGDHPHTVGAIAREVGLPGSAEVVDARELGDEALAEAAVTNTVFGRVAPHQKRAMIQALQARGHVVAMTGDGVNDVLALKDADIGVALGSGSHAARAVAQLVLIDGRFDTLPSVVAEGRRVIGNIERVANLFVTKTVYAILLAIAVGLAARPFPFLPRHLTLVGSVTIGIPAFFLALAPTARRARPGFIRRVLRFAIPTGVAAGLATLAAYELAITEQVSLTEARTTATLVLAALGLFALGIVARPLETWKKGLLWAMAGLLVLLVAARPLRMFFALETPRVAILMAAVGVVAITGTIMVGSLHMLGWLRDLPELLRHYEPTSARTWQDLRANLRRFFAPARPPGAHRPPSPGAAEATGHPEAARPVTTTGSGGESDRPDDSPPSRPHQAAAEEPEQQVVGITEWFDPDEHFPTGPDPDDDPLADIPPIDPQPDRR